LRGTGLMRALFWLCLTVIAAGIGFAIVVGVSAV
jgi:hypothetical protein